MDNQTEKKTNVLAILGFVFSFLVALIGLILSIIGLSKSKELNSGRGLSIAGIIISVLNMVLGLVLAIVMVASVPTVLNTIDKAKEATLLNEANTIEMWFERQYSLAKINTEATNSVYNNYVMYNDYTISEQRLTREIVEEIRITDIDNIDYTNSTVKLNNNRVCVKLTAFVNDKRIEKQSTGCNY